LLFTNNRRAGLPHTLNSEDYQKFALAELEAAARSTTFKARQFHLDQAGIFAAEGENCRRAEGDIGSSAADPASLKSTVGMHNVQAVSDQELVEALERADNRRGAGHIEMLLAEVARRAGSVSDV
jgi:hypothetical protein